MRHDKLEAVMRAAWRAADPNVTDPVEQAGRLMGLGWALDKADPHGVYKPDATDSEPYVSLRDSPRMPRDPEDL
jgi:hypothetical protein